MLLFGYRLADHLKVADVEGMLDTLTIDQIDRWAAFFRIQAKEREEERMQQELSQSTHQGVQRAKEWR